MKRFFYTIIIVLSLFIIAGCTNNNLNSTDSNRDNKIQDNEKVGDNEMTNIKVIINNITYTANIEQNETTKELINMLPLELNMNDLNKNEKYYYLNKQLPTNSYKPNTIEKGDIMLYGDNCLVIFYESFETSFSYTKIGHINNMPNLNEESIVIKFEE